jgi:hypothetical protein
MTAGRSGPPALTIALAAALGGCGYEGPPLAGYPGLQFEVVSFYDARAIEGAAVCTRPRMTPTRATVVEETPERVVMDVRYHFRDESHDDLSLGQARCNGWAERTFTLAKTAGGGLDVVAMTGPQRR